MGNILTLLDVDIEVVDLVCAPKLYTECGHKKIHLILQTLVNLFNLTNKDQLI